MNSFSKRSVDLGVETGTSTLLAGESRRLYAWVPFLIVLLIVVAMIYDWRTRGKIHRVYLIGGPALLFLQVIRVPLSTTPAWHAIAEWVAGLAG